MGPRRIRRLGRRSLAATMALAALAPAVTTAADAPAGSHVAGATRSADADATLRWGKSSELLSFDPAVAGDATTWQYLYLVYETLVEMGPDLLPAPGLAESWENPEPTTWVFHLRDGVRFSNGRQLTADDVVGSLQRLIDPELAAWWVPQMGDVTSVSAVDDRTVQIELAAPNSKLLGALAGVSASILPMAELNAAEFDPTTEMLGTGPYQVADHKQDESWTFDANPEYWRDGAPGFARVEVQIIPDDAALVAALRDGRVDVAFFDNPDAPALLAGIDGIETTVQNTTDLYVLHLNNVDESSVMADPLVRQAISMAIDHTMINDLALAGTAEVSAVTPPGFAESCDPASLPSAAGDLDAARELLDEAGVDDLEFDLLTTPVIPQLSLIAQVIQQNLDEIGVQVNVTELEYGAWNDRIYLTSPADFDAALSFYAGYGDPTMMPLYLDVERSVWPGSFLAPDAELADALRAAETAEPGSDERAELLATVCTLADTDAGWVPLLTKPVVVAVDTATVDATIQPVEGYSDVLRFIADFTPAA